MSSEENYLGTGLQRTASGSNILDLLQCSNIQPLNAVTCIAMMNIIVLHIIFILDISAQLSH